KQTLEISKSNWQQKPQLLSRKWEKMRLRNLKQNSRPSGRQLEQIKRTTNRFQNSNGIGRYSPKIFSCSTILRFSKKKRVRLFGFFQEMPIDSIILLLPLKSCTRSGGLLL